MSKAVFLDTNVYLHYQLFDQINWLEVLSASAVTIVIPPVTVRELNKHKELHPRPRVRERAGTVLKKLSSLFESGLQTRLRDGIEMKLEDRDPNIDFAASQLNPGIQDDNLIASIIMLQNEKPRTEVILVTSDAGLTLVAKARRQGIVVASMSDNLKIPDEPDPDQKRIRDLEQELRELKLKAPKLSLTFENGEDHISFVLPQPVDLAQEELESKLEQVKQRYPRMEHQSEQARNPEGLTSVAQAIARLSTSWGNVVLPEDIDNYNTNLGKFYELCGEHLRESAQYRNLQCRTVKLTIFVANDGTAPAEDLDIFMHFPDGFELINERDFPEPPKPPEPPVKPKTQMEKMTDPFRGLSMTPPLEDYRIPPISSPSKNVSITNIKRTRSYDVDFHVRRIKHKLQEPIDEPLNIIFPSLESAQSFQIDYRILAASVPNEVNGQLHVVMEKNRQSRGVG
jgi:hypothetical protein